MMPRYVYAVDHSTGKVRALTVEEAREELKGTGAYPWLWLGSLCGGLTVTTNAATYAPTLCAARSTLATVAARNR